MTDPDSSQPLPDGSPDDDQSESGADGYLRPGWFSDRPRFAPEAIRALLNRLNEPWSDDPYQDCLRAYNRDRRVFAIMRFVGLYLLIVALYEVMMRSESPGFLNQPAGEQFMVIGPGLGLIAACWMIAVLVSRNVSFARMRFFRHLGKAIDPVWAASRDRSMDIDVLYVLNRLGVASRALFLALQGSRRTWKAPPMVADRAAMLASTLIDFDIPDDLHLRDAASRDALHRFLQDVAAVVVINREDLLPRVRETYQELPSRSVADEAKRERDLRYLHPLRDRGRWDVAKDFWYPLAPWLSLLVSVAAIVVSFRR